MQPFARPLGDAAKKARAEINLTQRQVAGRIGADARSVLNIENYKGNPKIQILFPPVRELQIDAREVFYPKMGRKHHAIRHQRLAVEACDEALAEALLPVVESVLKILHEKNAAKSGGDCPKSEKPAVPQRTADSQRYGAISSIGIILSCAIVTKVSFLHLGQQSGKLTITVSARTLVRVLFPQTRQRAQKGSL